MTYEETIELEENVRIKNTAEKIFSDFKKYTSVDVSEYEGDGKFKIWSDEHNATYLVFSKDSIRFKCSFLHESYDVLISESGIFNAIKSKGRGIDHLVATIDSFRRKK